MNASFIILCLIAAVAAAFIYVFSQIKFMNKAISVHSRRITLLEETVMPEYSKNDGHVEYVCMDDGSWRKVHLADANNKLHNRKKKGK